MGVEGVPHQEHQAVYYYIAPKIWAWKEYRIKNIKRDVDELFSILPFEIDFFEGKHQYPIHYVGNPTLDEVVAFRASYKETRQDFFERNGLQAKPVIALLAGSRKQEIKDNLPDMIRAASSFGGYQLVLAGAPGIDADYYRAYIGDAISLVNLIAGREVVRELVADTMTVAQIKIELGRILNDESWRREMLAGYDEVSKRLGEPGAPAKAARLIRSLLAKG